jgi:hypothetical protein
MSVYLCPKASLIVAPCRLVEELLRHTMRQLRQIEPLRPFAVPMDMPLPVSAHSRTVRNSASSRRMASTEEVYDRARTMRVVFATC